MGTGRRSLWPEPSEDLAKYVCTVLETRSSDTKPYVSTIGTTRDRRFKTRSIMANCFCSRKHLRETFPCVARLTPSLVRNPLPASVRSPLGADSRLHSVRRCGCPLSFTACEHWRQGLDRRHAFTADSFEHHGWLRNTAGSRCYDAACTLRAQPAYAHPATAEGRLERRTEVLPTLCIHTAALQSAACPRHHSAVTAATLAVIRLLITVIWGPSRRIALSRLDRQLKLSTATCAAAQMRSHPGHMVG